MGGARDYESLSSAYSEFQGQLKDRLQSRILPIGALSVGLARHRALLFKTLADACELPCRLLRGPAIGMHPSCTEHINKTSRLCITDKQQISACWCHVHMTAEHRALSFETRAKACELPCRLMCALGRSPKTCLSSTAYSIPVAVWAGFAG